MRRSASPELLNGMQRSFSSLNQAKIPSVYQVYPAPLHLDTNIPKRVNVLRPAPHGVYNSFTETWENNWRNMSRSLLMQQREHFRYHDAWKPYFYGSPSEKELHNKLIREGLKEQMSDKWKHQKAIFEARVQESMDAVAHDKHDVEAELDKQRRYREMMKAYCVANKSMMEERERLKHTEKLADVAQESELIRYNPVNWSCSLK